MENIGKEIEGRKAFKLNLTEEFYLRLITLSLDAIVIHKNAKIVYVNPAGIKMIRARSLNNLLGRPIMDFIHRSSQDLAKKRISEMLTRGRISKPIEERFIRFDNTILETEVTSLPFWYQDGLAILSIIRDKTKEKQSEAELSKLTTIVKSSDDAIFNRDLNGIIQSWNKGAEKLYGYTAKEMIGQSINIICPSNKMGEIKKIINNIRKDIPMKRLRTTRLNKYGKEINVLLNISPIKNKAGKIVGSITIARNIAKLRQATYDLPKLANVAKYTADGVFITDRRGIIQYVNPAFEKITEFSKKEAIGQTPRIIKSGHHDKSFYRKLWDTIISGGTFRKTMVNKKKNGEIFYVDHTITPVKDKSGTITHFVGIWKDITEQMQLEKRKDDFIGIASHELKTPLTSISLYTQALNNMFSKEESNGYSKYIGKINTQIYRLTNLINQLLDISKIQAGKLVFNKEYTDLNYLFGDIMETMQLTTRKHSLILKGNVNHKVYCDKERIGQVMINLLSNAIKYSPDGGEIIVKIANGNNKISVSVKDQGIGIPKKYQKKIFERFFRAGVAKYANYPGMGIGLYLSNEIIKQHHGRMWLESEDAKGATFYFNLPLERN